MCRKVGLEMSTTEMVAYVLCVTMIISYGVYLVAMIVNTVAEGIRDNKAAAEMRRHQANFERRWSEESPFI